MAICTSTKVADRAVTADNRAKDRQLTNAGEDRPFKALFASVKRVFTRPSAVLAVASQTAAVEDVARLVETTARTLNAPRLAGAKAHIAEKAALTDDKRLELIDYVGDAVDYTHAAVAYKAGIEHRVAQHEVADGNDTWRDAHFKKEQAVNDTLAKIEKREEKLQKVIDKTGRPGTKEQAQLAKARDAAELRLSELDEQRSEHLSTREPGAPLTPSELRDAVSRHRSLARDLDKVNKGANAAWESLGRDAIWRAHAGQEVSVDAATLEAAQQVPGGFARLGLYVGLMDNPAETSQSPVRLEAARQAASALAADRASVNPITPTVARALPTISVSQGI